MTLPNPNLPPVTHMGEIGQLGEFRAGWLAYARRGKQPQTCVGPRPGLAIPIEGLTTEEVRSFPMDTQQISASSRASSRVRGDATPSSGATDPLAGLHHRDPRLSLSARDVDALAPGVAAWLEREVGPAAVQHALNSDLLPEGVSCPAGLLAHRLATRLPPPPPFRTPADLPPRPIPLQNGEGRDRAFRAAEPGECPDCRTDHFPPTAQQL